MNADGVLAIKGYLYRPTRYIEEIHDLEQTLRDAARLDLPVIVDPSLPNPRMLFMASPCRTLSLEKRADVQDFSDMQHFAGAFPDDVIDSGENSPGSNEEQKERDLEKRFSLVDAKNETDFYRSVQHRISLISDANIVLKPNSIDAKEETSHPPPKKHRKNLSDIYQDLDKRIKQSQDNIEHLSRAEFSLYSQAGITTGEREETTATERHVPMITPAHSCPDISSSLSASPLSLQDRRKLRPTLLDVVKQKPKEETLYVRYLANCPDS